MFIFVLDVYNIVILCVNRTVHITGALLHLWHISTIIHCTRRQVAPSLLCILCSVLATLLFVGVGGMSQLQGTGMMHWRAIIKGAVASIMGPVVGEERLGPVIEFFWL